MKGFERDWRAVADKLPSLFVDFLIEMADRVRYLVLNNNITTHLTNGELGKDTNNIKQDAQPCICCVMLEADWQGEKVPLQTDLQKTLNHNFPLQWIVDKIQ